MNQLPEQTETVAKFKEVRKRGRPKGSGLKWSDTQLELIAAEMEKYFLQCQQDLRDGIAKVKIPFFSEFCRLHEMP